MADREVPVTCRAIQMPSSIQVERLPEDQQPEHHTGITIPATEENDQTISDPAVLVVTMWAELDKPLADQGSVTHLHFDSLIAPNLTMRQLEDIRKAVNSLLDAAIASGGTLMPFHGGLTH